MGNIKISFTTALFVFSFLVCVVVAVLFVDKGTPEDEDFPAPAIRRTVEATATPVVDNSGWQAVDIKQDIAPTQSVAPTALPVNPAEANLADLPIDPRVAGSVVNPPSQYPMATPYAAGGTPQAIITPNPFAGKSAEQIARELRGRAHLAGQGPAVTPPPMAIPGGIPGMQTSATPTPSPTPKSQGYIPIATNAKSMGPSIGSSTPAPFNPFDQSFDSPAQFSTGSGGYDSMLQNLAGSNPAPATTNSGSGWDPVQTQTSPAGFHIQGQDSSSRPPMMIQKGSVNPATSNDMPISGESLTPPGGAALPVSPAGGLPSLSTGGTSSLGTDGMSLPPVSDSKVTDPSKLNLENVSPSVAAVFEKSVAAKVNSQVLSAEEAEKRSRVTAKLLNEKITEDNKQQKTRFAAEDWATIAVMAEEAKSKGTGISASEIERYAAMQPGLKVDEYKTSMKEEGFSDAAIEEDLRQIALGEKWVEESVLKEYSDEKLREIYNKKPSDFTPPKEYKVQEIFKLRPDNEAERAKVVDEMNRLQRQASGGTDFGLLASQASEAPSKTKGGDLGWIDEESHIPPAMADALLKLKPGEISSVVEDENGYRIYRLVDVKEPLPGFEGGKEMVVKSLKGAMRNKLLAEARANQEVELTHKKNTKVASNRPGESKSSGSSSGRVSTGGNNSGVPNFANQSSGAAGNQEFILKPPPEALMTTNQPASDPTGGFPSQPMQQNPPAAPAVAGQPAAGGDVPPGFEQSGNAPAGNQPQQERRGLGSRLKSMFGRS